MQLKERYTELVCILNTQYGGHMPLNEVSAHAAWIARAERVAELVKSGVRIDRAATEAELEWDRLQL